MRLPKFGAELKNFAGDIAPAMPKSGVRAKTNFAKLFKAIGAVRPLTKNIPLSFFQKT
jgi:hypothetical protein